MDLVGGQVAVDLQYLVEIRDPSSLRHVKAPNAVLVSKCSEKGPQSKNKKQ
jgi:hypothetical protein